MAARCHPDFERPLGRLFSRPELDDSTGTIFGLWPDGTLAYVNAAWDLFAAANGAGPDFARRWDLGASYFDAMTPPLRPFFRDLLARAPVPDNLARPPAHEYECSSADVFRRFCLHVYALPGAAGFLMVNSTLLERPHDIVRRPPRLATPENYRDDQGVIHQCSHCRRVLSAVGPDRWDWVPAWVERIPVEMTHTICPICFDYYYPAPL